MNDQQLGALIDSWLKDSDCPPSDVGRSTAQIESRLPQTGQRSRWWPLPSLERLTVPRAGRVPAGGSSMYSAAKFVAAAAIVALFGGFLLTGVLTTQQDDEVLPAAVTESPSPTTTEADALQLVTEEVEPGVERIISDGAGHDLDGTDSTYGHVMDSVVLAADGTLWLESFSEFDDEERFVWALGQPGLYGVEQGVPEDGGFLVPLNDGALLIVAGDVVRFDGEAFVPDDGPAYRHMPGYSRTLWLIEPDVLMGLVPEGESAARPRSVLPAIWTGWDWLSPEAFARVYTDGRDTWCGTGGVGVTCEDPRGNVTAYLADTPINQLVMTPDRSVWAVSGYDGGLGGLYRITLPPVE